MESVPNKQTAKLQKIIERLSGGKIVQNRQLKTVLGTEMIDRHYSKYSPLLNAEVHSGRKKKP